MTAPRIDAILFDLGGVLIELAGVEPDARVVARQLPDATSSGGAGCTRRRCAASRPAARRAHAFAADDRRRVRPAGRRRTSSSPRSAYWPRALLSDGAASCWPSCAPRYRLASVSNTNEIHWRALRATNGRSHGAVPSQLSVAPVGAPEARRRLLRARARRARHAAPTRVLFVDDNAINVDAAARLGIVARRVVGPQGVRAALAELALQPETAT